MSTIQFYKNRQAPLKNEHKKNTLKRSNNFYQYLNTLKRVNKKICFHKNNFKIKRKKIDNGKKQYTS